MAKAELKDLLEEILRAYPPIKRVKDDPVQFARGFYDKKRSKAEIEAVALFSAMLSYGSAKQFIKIIKATLEMCDFDFLLFIQQKARFRNTFNSYKWPAYRLSTSEEIKAFACAIGLTIQNEGGLETVFLSGYLPDRDIIAGLTKLHGKISEYAAQIVSPIPRGLRHLLPDPASGSCAKRWQMFLRWMVRRNDGVDMGLWKEVYPADLIIPLDRHISKISRNLGLTQKTTDTLNTAKEITEALSKFSPKDPVKYDFALCHLGISGECTHGRTAEPCQKCLLKPCCAVKQGK